MFGGKEEDGFTTISETNSGDKATVIGKAVKVEGVLSAKENIRIEGIIEGKVKTEKDLVVGEGAVINADINAGTARIAGDVQGNVTVKNKLELSATAKITGNIRAKVVIMAEGAVLNGKCVMGEEAVVAIKENPQMIEKEKHIEKK
jgi:cytoskeletal protein CcmA (bactofilin family)